MSDAAAGQIVAFQRSGTYTAGGTTVAGTPYFVSATAGGIFGLSLAADRLAAAGCCGCVGFGLVLICVRLVRENFWATLGLILLTSFISLGVGLLMLQLASLNNIGAAIAVVINAYVGTGLTMALLVFYRTRFIRTEEI